MLSFLVIGICIILLISVIFFSIKPISMGIEARRHIKDDKLNNEEKETIQDDSEFIKKEQISLEITKLNELKNDGVLTEEEFQNAKNKLLD